MRDGEQYICRERGERKGERERKRERERKKEREREGEVSRKKERERERETRQSTYISTVSQASNRSFMTRESMKKLRRVCRHIIYMNLSIIT